MAIWLVAAAAGQAGAAGATSRPVVKDDMKREEFEKRFRAAVAELPDVEERSKAKGAAWGYRITSVEAGSYGENIGLKVGETIERMDGRRVWSEPQVMGQAAGAAGQHEVTVVGEDLAERTVKVDSGLAGVQGLRWWDPELVYLRGPHRDAKWDDLMRVAIARCDDEPKLAGAALSRALAAGYPADGVMDMVAFAIAVGEGRTKEALAFANARIGGEYGADLPLPPKLLYQAAIAEGRFKVARDAMKDAAPDLMPDRSAQVEELIAADAAKTAEERRQPPPAVMADSRERQGQLQASKPLDQDAEWLLQKVRRHEVFRWKAETGHYLPAVFGPDHDLSDVELQVTFSVKRTDRKTSRWAKMFAVGIVDRDDLRPPSILEDGMPGGLLGFEVDATGPSPLMGVIHGKGQELVFEPCRFAVNGQDQVELRLLHCAGRDEVVVNGRRIAYLPQVAPQAKRLGVYVKVVGMEATISKLRFDELVAKQGNH